MTKEEFAKKLDGREYREEITREEAAEAKKNNLVVVFGASDDLIEFRGAIYDEINAWGGEIVLLDKDGLITNQCDNECCPYFLALKESATKIAAIWNPPEYKCVSWAYKTEMLPLDLPPQRYNRLTLLEDQSFGQDQQIAYPWPSLPAGSF